MLIEMLRSDTEHFLELFANLKVSYIEEETRERYLRTMVTVDLAERVAAAAAMSHSLSKCTLHT